jgi:hypothetical protein
VLPTGYIRIPIQTDAAAMADDAIARWVAAYPGYVPNDGDPEVVQIEALAPMAANAAQAAVLVPPAVLRTVAVRLHGIAYQAGQAATTTVTFTMTDTTAHTIPAGTEIDIDGYAFTVDTDTPTAALTVPGVPVTCATIGTEANGLPGDDVVLASALAFVASVTVDAPTADGVDPEDDDAFQDRASRKLQLRGDTLVTPADYELEALDQVGIGRAIATVDVATKTMHVVVTAADGTAAASADKTALAATYAALRQTNWAVTVDDPTYTPVSVTYSVHPYPGFAAADLLARCDAALEAYLSPSGFGLQRSTGDTTATTTTWVPDNVVRKNKLIDLLGDVDGVDYVADLTITGAGAGGDLTLTGTVALPTPGTMAGTVV